MVECELPLNNPPGEEIKSILLTAKIIAIVGLSNNPERDSYRVASYLKEHGYKIIPVNPGATEILGEKVYKHLEEVPEHIDIVDIFRKPEAVPEIVDSAIKIGAKVVWMQEGIVHNISAQKAINAGLKVVMNKCIMKEHKKILARYGRDK